MGCLRRSSCRRSRCNRRAWRTWTCQLHSKTLRRIRLSCRHRRRRLQEPPPRADRYRRQLCWWLRRRQPDSHRRLRHLCRRRLLQCLCKHRRPILRLLRMPRCLPVLGRRPRVQPPAAACRTRHRPLGSRTCVGPRWTPRRRRPRRLRPPTATPASASRTSPRCSSRRSRQFLAPLRLLRQRGLRTFRPRRRLWHRWWILSPPPARQVLVFCRPHHRQVPWHLRHRERQRQRRRRQQWRQHGGRRRAERWRSSPAARARVATTAARTVREVGSTGSPRGGEAVGPGIGSWRPWRAYRTVRLDFRQKIQVSSLMMPPTCGSHRPR
mmetsp:Transcript_124416/g.398434  ORF Transcript_124416/g.398434 Transcript_124416/m.398434 type:complete len:324 (-) Transcript_124416:1480-2451(-)